ncbi:MAG: DNA polymerase III subunit delta [Patescibacteria group bacterium]|jgi:DNA polymerase-3 subunit delta|nr:DNA polymerase III subunit delta [Patescibacteria group bacterium]
MITLLYGENNQLRDEAIAQIHKQFVNQHGDMAVDSIDAEFATKEELINAVTTVPFLANKRLVIVRYLSANKELVAEINQILDFTAESTDLVLIESSLDSRSVYTKTLVSRCDDVRKYDSLDAPQVVDWIINIVNKAGGTISKPDASYLIERIGNNQITLSGEISKILLVNKKINKELINQLTVAVPQSSVFAMLDALSAGDVAVASRLYQEQRQQGMEPQAILGMIAWQLVVIATVFSYGNESSDTVAKKAKLSPFVVRKNQNLAKKLSKQNLVSMFDVAIATDLLIKTNKAKPDMAVHSLLISLADKLKTARQ